MKASLFSAAVQDPYTAQHSTLYNLIPYKVQNGELQRLQNLYDLTIYASTSTLTIVHTTVLHESAI